jgi:Protein of unknown function (DUF3455)
MHKPSWIFCSLVASFASVGFVSTAYAAPDSATAIPASLQTPADQQLLFKVVAQGDQIYVCQAKADQADQFEWTLKAPEAVLLNDKNQKVGTHYGGPTWESADGSAIVGQVKAKDNAPQADAIPWLLLEVKSHKGEGQFSAINWVQRVNTSGGKAPKTGCDRDQQGKQTRSGYSADYQFYGATQHAVNQNVVNPVSDHSEDY